MDEPIIENVDGELFSTGSINVYGRNFNANTVLLLIDGIESRIISVNDNKISGTIPILDKTGIYDVKIMTRSVTKRNKNLFSNPYFVKIRSISQEEKDLRHGLLPIISDDEDKLSSTSSSTVSSESSNSPFESTSSSSDNSSSSDSNSSYESDSSISGSSDQSSSSSDQSDSSLSDESISSFSSSDTSNSSESSSSESSSSSSEFSESSSSSSESSSSELSESSSSSSSSDNLEGLFIPAGWIRHNDRNATPTPTITTSLGTGFEFDTHSGSGDQRGSMYLFFALPRSSLNGRTIRMDASSVVTFGPDNLGDPSLSFFVWDVDVDTDGLPDTSSSVEFPFNTRWAPDTATRVLQTSTSGLIVRENESRIVLEYNVGSSELNPGYETLLCGIRVADNEPTAGGVTTLYDLSIRDTSTGVIYEQIVSVDAMAVTSTSIHAGGEYGTWSHT